MTGMFIERDANKHLEISAPFIDVYYAILSPQGYLTLSYWSIFDNIKI